MRPFRRLPRLLAAALDGSRRRIRHDRELVLAAVFVALASYEIFEIVVFEVGGTPLSLLLLVHGLQVLVILAATWMMLGAWREKTAREEALASLVEKVVFAQEEERRRLAYEIHDGLSPLIVSAKQHIDVCQDVWEADTARALGELARGLDRLRRAVDETRHVLLALRPSAVDAIGLVPAARELLAEAAHEGGWSFTFAENLEGERLAPAVESAIFRILQEGLVNTLRHAQAQHVDVALRREGPWVLLDVRDHGVGLAATGGRGLGLQSMRERARLLGGICTIERATHRGTRISARLPIEMGGLEGPRASTWGGLEGPPNPPSSARPGEAVTRGLVEWGASKGPPTPPSSARSGEAVTRLDSTQ